MTSKHILIFCYPTYHSYYPTLRMMEAWEYDVTSDGIEFVEESDALVRNDKHDPDLLSVDRLINYDVIVILVEEGEIVPRGIIISKEFINGLKERIKVVEMQKGSPVRLVGMNTALLGQEAAMEQAEIFDGLFISGDILPWDQLHKHIHSYLG